MQDCGEPTIGVLLLLASSTDSGVDEHCRLLVIATCLLAAHSCKQLCAWLNAGVLAYVIGCSRRTASGGPGACDGAATAANRVLAGYAARTVRSVISGVCDLVGGIDEVSV